MISEATKTQDSYQAAFQALQANEAVSPANAWLTRLRAAAMDRFESLGFPAVSEEEWKYTNVAPIARGGFSPNVVSSKSLGAGDIASFAYPETETSKLVFINGAYDTELSSLTGLSNEVVALDFAAALNDERLSVLMREHLGRVVDYNENGFTALNTAFVGNGAIVLIPKGVSVATPLHLLFVTHSDSVETATFPRVLIVAEENTQATVIESYVATGEQAYFTNAVIEVVLKDGARLEHYRVQDESEGAFHIATMEADLARSSRFDTTSISLGAKLSRHNINVIMNDEGAECAVDGLYIMADDQHTDTHSVIEHKFPHCTSRQLYKGILDGKSRAVFNGKVFVRHGALGTDAQQTNKNLLLSNDAHVDTKPQLEIFADDVKCAHGAAIGQLDEDELFYLESRGIHTDLARNLLTYGFAEEVITKIKIESIKAQLDEAVLNRLHARLEA
ncbi:MAG TPA: Fe-S cluster assembly protein SufD [Pyrinomonadaceae bacterium]|nr:Fe-S cluster assembly protein SufD [Pyrinomonadaceae bacterium]